MPLANNSISLLQHEGWTDESATPLIAATKPEALDKMSKAVAKMLKLPTIRGVLDRAGADEYWSQFMDTVLTDKEALGDGSRLFR